MLAFETATDRCSVALFYQQQHFLLEAKEPRLHAKSLLPMIDSVLKTANISLSELDALSCSIGPGSFTGIRIGVAVAQGLAFGAEKPVLGISTLEAMAHGLFRKEGYTRVLAVLDAKCGQWFAGVYEILEFGKTQVLEEPSLVESVTLVALEKKVQGIASTEEAFPQAYDVGILAKTRFKPENKYSPRDLVPLYVREEVAQKM